MNKADRKEFDDQVNQTLFRHLKEFNSIYALKHLYHEKFDVISDMIYRYGVQMSIESIKDFATELGVNVQSYVDKDSTFDAVIRDINRGIKNGTLSKNDFE